MMNMFYVITTYSNRHIHQGDFVVKIVVIPEWPESIHYFEKSLSLIFYTEEIIIFGKFVSGTFYQNDKYPCLYYTPVKGHKTRIRLCLSLLQE